MSRFGKGHLPERARPKKGLGHLLASGPPAQGYPSVYRFRRGTIWQGSIGRCLPSGFARSQQLWCAAHDYPDDMTSQKWGYVIGRREEYAGQDPESLPPLEDVGTRPDAFTSAAQRVGVVLDVDYPSDQQGPNDEPPERVQRLAFDHQGLDTFGIDAGDLLGAESALTRYQPPGFAVRVGSPFEAWTCSSPDDDPIVDLGSDEPDAGGHWLVVLEIIRAGEVMIGADPIRRDILEPMAARVGDLVRFDNWWRNVPAGYVWGLSDGTGVMTAKLWQDNAQEVTAVRGAPLIRRIAA